MRTLNQLASVSVHLACLAGLGYGRSLRHPSWFPVPATRDDLFQRLAELGIETRTVEHAPVFTVAESAELDRSLPGGHTKNLFLKDAKDRLFLVIAHAHTAVDLKGLPRLIGSGRLSFGKADLMQAVLGVTPGSVTAFALINDTGRQVDVILDAVLMQYDTVNCHPLTNAATTNIARDDLLRFIRACGHAPRILYVSGGDIPPPPT
jgi:Ala-tRNA(Pro) deacylase